MKPSAIYHNLKNLSKRNTITLLNRMTEAPPPPFLPRALKIHKIHTYVQQASLRMGSAFQAACAAAVKKAWVKSSMYVCMYTSHEGLAYVGLAVAEYMSMQGRWG